MLEIEKIFAKNHVYVQFTPWKLHILHFLCFSKKHDFELETLLPVTFWTEKNRTRQILNSNKYIASFFDLKKKTRQILI